MMILGAVEENVEDDQGGDANHGRRSKRNVDNQSGIVLSHDNVAVIYGGLVAHIGIVARPRINDRRRKWGPCCSTRW
jgi:hypothetical protein